MNERIKDLAKQAWSEGGDEVHSGKKLAMEKFAELIRADEREACAKVCDDAVGTWNGWPQAKAALTVGAIAIRARGNA